MRGIWKTLNYESKTVHFVNINDSNIDAKNFNVAKSISNPYENVILIEEHEQNLGKKSFLDKAIEHDAQISNIDNNDS